MKPILHLAPMCNITNRATRQIVKNFGCNVTWSEMISSEGLVRQDLKNNKSLKLAQKFNHDESSYWVQIFGTDPANMAQAAKIIEKTIKPTGIDINLGCPVPKAQKGGYGAIQINNIPQVIKIIKAIKKQISIPLSLKTRIGLKNPVEILNFAPKLEKAGLDQLVVHARTLKGLFKEKPHWEIVKKLNNTLSIPVIYNGGIDTPQKAEFYYRKTGCQNLMIGQGAIGNPWIFQEIKNYFSDNFHNKPPTPSLTTKQKKVKIIQHAKLTTQYFGPKGLIGFRTQLSAYLRHLSAPKKIRSQAVKITTLKELEKLIQKF